MAANGCFLPIQFFRLGLKGTSPNDYNSRSLGNRKTSKDKNLSKQFVRIFAIYHIKGDTEKNRIVNKKRLKGWPKG